MYLTQVLVIGLALLLLLRKSSIILQVQVLIWMIGVIVLTYRFGLTEQLNFYSNDQRFYTDVANDLRLMSFSSDIDWWLTYSKIPYTLPAGILTWIGINPILALKVVSLICLLLVTRLVLATFPSTAFKHVVMTVFISACGGIGMLYSILALRETMMMLFVTYFCVSRIPAVRLTTLILLLLLRPHLAAVLIVAWLIGWIWESYRHRQESIQSLVSLVLISVLLGRLLFIAGLWYDDGVTLEGAQYWGVQDTLKVFSSLVGLQFLTADSETVELSISTLLGLRLFLSETIVIPMLFTITIFLRPERDKLRLG